MCVVVYTRGISNTTREEKQMENYKLNIEVEIDGAYQKIEVDKVYPTIQKARSALAGQMAKYDRKEMCARGSIVAA
jgi:hypothetical protein